MTKQHCDSLVKDFFLVGAEYIHRDSGCKYELKEIKVLVDGMKAGEHAIQCEFVNISYSFFPQRFRFKFISPTDTDRFERIRMASLK